jgi:hypothetical protein
MHIFKLSRWLCQDNVFVSIFALVQHVVTLCLLWLLAQLFQQPGVVVQAIAQSTLDVYGSK